MQHYSTDDLYPLDSFLLSEQQQQLAFHYQQQQQQQQQMYAQPQPQQLQHHQHQHQHQQQHHHHHHAAQVAAHQPQPQQYEYTAPVSRHIPSTRAYSYHPYAASNPSPRVSRYVAPWDVQVPTLNDYASSSPLLDYSPYGSMHAADALSFPLYTPTTVNPYQTMQLPTCIAPEDLFTPISPSSLTDNSDDRAVSPLSATDNSSSSSNSSRSSPTRLGLQIPTNILSSISSGSSLAPSSCLPSPVDSISSNDSEQAFIPTPSLRKSSTKTAGAKRSTRSAAPEPAWVEAVLAEDAKRIQEGIDGASTPMMNSSGGRPTNRPIAFACVFCRHRKIQCIRPKVEAGPGEKPLPCNQCEKRSRCCEYPPAALNPRMGRRVRDKTSSNED